MEELEIQSVGSKPEGENENLQNSANSDDTAPAEENLETVNEDDKESVDYARVAAEDIAALKAEFPELSDVSDICELNNPLRYAALRDLGLSPAEAYLATAKRAPRRDNRSHLSAIRTVSYAPQGSMTESEMAMARELFSDISDGEIRKLYKKVNK